MRQNVLLVALCFLFSVSSFSQNKSASEKITISGTIKDGKTGEEMIGATIMLKDTIGIGAVTNAYGFYSLTIPVSKNQLLVRYIGYQDFSITLDSLKIRLLVFRFCPLPKH